MSSTQNIELCLQKLGFTNLEAEIYLYLLKHGTSTGYGVSKGIGKAVANVYKGLDSLALKGGVVEATSDKKQFTATPWQQLLKQQEENHKQTIDALADAFKTMPAIEDDEQIYQVKHAEQALAAAEQMINEAENIILADIEPAVVPRLANALIEAASRGVEVRVKVYQRVELPGVNITLRDNGKVIYDKLREASIRVSADGKNCITALIGRELDYVVQAFRTKSALINMNIYTGLLYELVLTEIKQASIEDSLEGIQSILSETEHLHPFTTSNVVFEQYRKRYHS